MNGEEQPSATRVPGPGRVCHLASGDVWGGLEAVVLNLLRAQRDAAGWEPSLIVFNAGRLEEEARLAGIPVTLIPEHETRFPRLLAETDLALARIRPTVIHSHRYKENLLAFLLARRHRARPVVTIHGFEPPAGRAARIRLEVRERVIRGLGRLVGARFIAVSEELRRRHHADLVIPNGIAMPAPVRAARDSGDVAPSMIGWIGRLVPVKGVETLIEAFALLAGGDARLRLLLVGDGPDRARLATLAKVRGVADRVEFAGEVQDVAPMLARMDVFAFPSLREGVPLALLEAMGAGVPVVAAAVGGIPDVIGGPEAGMLVRTRAPGDWARAIADTLADRASADARARQARERVRTRFSCEAMTAAYAEAYGSPAIASATQAPLTG